MSLAEPIVEGAYYLREDGSIGRAVVSGDWHEVCGDGYYDDGEPHDSLSPRLTRRVWITHADPAEVVAELRQCAMEASHGPGPESEQAYVDRCDGRHDAFSEAADLVAEKLVGGG